MEGWVDLGSGYILRWFACLQTVIRPSSKHWIVTWPGVEPVIFWLQVQHANHYTLPAAMKTQGCGRRGNCCLFVCRRRLQQTETDMETTRQECFRRVSDMEKRLQSVSAEKDALKISLHDVELDISRRQVTSSLLLLLMMMMMMIRKVTIFSTENLAKFCSAVWHIMQNFTARLLPAEHKKRK